MAAILTRSGYLVTEVRSGKAAIAALLAENADFALAFLDGLRSPVEGRHVLAVLRESGLQIPVILASGSFLAEDLQSSDPRVSFLSKPFSIEDLLQTVARLVQG